MIQNKLENVDFAARINLDDAMITGFVIKSNTAKSVLMLVYPTSLSVFDLQNGSIESNIVTGGAVLSIRESPQIAFSSTITTSSINLNIQGVDYTSNINLADP